MCMHRTARAVLTIPDRHGQRAPFFSLRHGLKNEKEAGPNYRPLSARGGDTAAEMACPELPRARTDQASLRPVTVNIRGSRRVACSSKQGLQKKRYHSTSETPSRPPPLLRPSPTQCSSLPAAPATARGLHRTRVTQKKKKRGELQSVSGLLRGEQ